MKEILERLRSKKVKLTPQRIAVLEYLEKVHNHPTVDDIYKAIKKKYPTMSLATVYATLELLKNLGEIQELSIRKRSKACFELGQKSHHHLLCRNCGKVMDIHFDCPNGCPIIQEVKIGGCYVDEVQAYLYGLCPECLKKEKEKARLENE
ncbi:transcriptional repressor [bacterium]|nr:transcriptional repressor [bacterium]